MKKSIFMLCIASLLIISCAKEKQPKELSFADIEKEFGFDNPLTEISKILILDKYGNLENFKKVLIKYKTIKNNFNTTLKSSQYFDVYISNDYNEVHTCQCPDNLNIVDAFYARGVQLPYSCKSGACSTCMMRIWGYGTVNQDDQSFLEEGDIEAGWVLSCVAYPTSDVDLNFDMESDYYTWKSNN